MVNTKYGILFAIGTVLFNHRHGCQKCLVEGQYIKEFHRMNFADLDAIRRTNESFRNRVQIIHHKEMSPFEELNIDMITSFPTSDPLHLLELGVMRKCLYRWVYGEKKYANKWSKALILFASRLLNKCGKEMPQDIHRAVRGLDTLRHWKGLEYRTFLLYIGCVTLKQVTLISQYKFWLKFIIFKISSIVLLL